MIKHRISRTGVKHLQRYKVLSIRCKTKRVLAESMAGVSGQMGFLMMGSDAPVLRPRAVSIHLGGYSSPLEGPRPLARWHSSRSATIPNPPQALRPRHEAATRTCLSRASSLASRYDRCHWPLLSVTSVPLSAPPPLGWGRARGSMFGSLSLHPGSE